MNECLNVNSETDEKIMNKDQKENILQENIVEIELTNDVNMHPIENLDFNPNVQNHDLEFELNLKNFIDNIIQDDDKTKINKQNTGNN